MCYSAGSTSVAAGVYTLTPQAYKWIAIIGAIIFSRLSMQDLPDKEGDAARGRRTSPLIMGDAFSRYEIAVPIFIWSLICPFFWRASSIGYIGPCGIGVWLVFRILRFRTVAGDKVSWKIWCLWTGMLYSLPLFTMTPTASIKR